MARFFKRRNGEQKKSKKAIIHEHAEEIVANVEEKLDSVESAEIVAEQTLKEAQDFITANSEANKIAELSKDDKSKATELLRAITKVLMDNEHIPDEAAGEFVKNLIQNDSRIVGVAVAEEASFIPDEQLKEIINIPEVGVKDAERIVTGINDKETRVEIQERINLAKLRELYDSCSQISDDSQLSSEIKKILNSGERTEKINNMVNKIIAKKIAYVYFKIPGATPIYKYTNVITPLQMLEVDLPELIDKEYKNLNVYDEKTLTEKFGIESRKEFDKKICEELIIVELADNLATQYASQDPTNRIMVIPESSVIRRFSLDEENKLIEELKVKCESKNSPLKKHQIQDIRNQIHGYIKTEEVDSLKTSLESISNPDLKRNIASQFEEILNTLQEFPEKQQEKMMDLLVEMSKQIASKVRKMEEFNKFTKENTEPNASSER